MGGNDRKHDLTHLACSSRLCVLYIAAKSWSPWGRDVSSGTVDGLLWKKKYIERPKWCCGVFELTFTKFFLETECVPCPSWMILPFYQKCFLIKRTLRVISCFLLLLPLSLPVSLSTHWFLSFLICLLSSFVLTCSLFVVLHPIFSFLRLSGVVRHPTDSSCFRKNQRRLPWDYAWVGFNDYIKPRTKSRTTCWDLMFCSGAGGGKGR